jgi:hypothetical protein
MTKPEPPMAFAIIAEDEDLGRLLLTASAPTAGLTPLVSIMEQKRSMQRYLETYRSSSSMSTCQPWMATPFAGGFANR